jgi:hypothetical protein
VGGAGTHASNVEGERREPGIRLAELVAAFSLATDLGLGQPVEHVLRSWRFEQVAAGARTVAFA